MIDSNILIGIERHWRTSGEQLFMQLPDNGLIAAITVSELIIGAHLADSPNRRAWRETFLTRVLSQFAVVPFGEREAREYASCYARMRRMGLLPGLADLQIAATALAGAHFVMTANRAEFERIPGIRLTPVVS